MADLTLASRRSGAAAPTKRTKKPTAPPAIPAVMNLDGHAYEVMRADAIMQLQMPSLMRAEYERHHGGNAPPSDEEFNEWWGRFQSGRDGIMFNVDLVFVPMNGAPPASAVLRGGMVDQQTLSLIFAAIAAFFGSAGDSSSEPGASPKRSKRTGAAGAPTTRRK